MNRPLLWRDMRSLSKSLCEALSRDHQSRTTSLSYCLQLVEEINKPLLASESPAVPPQTIQAKSICLGVEPSRGLFRKRTPVQLEDRHLLDQVLVAGAPRSVRMQALLGLAVKAAGQDMGALCLSTESDHTLYDELFCGMSSIQKIGKLRVINLLGHEGGAFAANGNGHTLDLFDGMDIDDVANWLCLMTPLSDNEPSRQPEAEILKEICPLVAALGFHLSIQSCARLRPSMLLEALDVSQYDRMQARLGPQGQKQLDLLQKVLGDPFSLESSLLKRLHGRIGMLVENAGYALDAECPQVGLRDAFERRQVVLVLAKQERSAFCAVDAICASLVQQLRKRPASRQLENIAILDRIIEGVGPEIAWRVSGLCSRGCGIVWSEDALLSNAQALRLQGNLDNKPWRQPQTHLLMRMPQGSLDEACKQALPSQGLASIQEVPFLADHQAILLENGQARKLLLDDTRPVLRTDAIIAHVPGLPWALPRDPGLVKRPKRTPPTRNLDRQAIALFNRLSEFDEKQMGHGYPPKLSWCQETVARMMGFAHWHEANVRCAP